MKRNGFDSTRRNLNIGTEASGHGADNKLVIPSSRYASRTWWEQLGVCEVEDRQIQGKSIRFIVETLRDGFYHPASVEDLAYLLSIVPAVDWEGIGAVVLRCPTRKQRILEPQWGRIAFSSNIGMAGKCDLYRGPAILLDSIQLVMSFKWSRSLDSSHSIELERLRRDGHRIQESRREYLIYVSEDSSRNTILYRTTLHEIGHWVDWKERVKRPNLEDLNHQEQLDDAYWSRSTDERESFAHRYSETLRDHLMQTGAIPFQAVR